eukprot:scaffold149810_cov48-Prasinocladus_malaysianus.AAC.1
MLQRYKAMIPESEIAPPPTGTSSQLARFNGQRPPTGHTPFPQAATNSVALAVQQGVFDVSPFHRFCSHASFSMEDGTLGISRMGGYKYRNPCLEALVLSPGTAKEGPEYELVAVRHGFASLENIQADPAKQLLWVSGKRRLRKGTITSIAGFNLLGAEGAVGGGDANVSGSLRCVRLASHIALHHH